MSNIKEPVARSNIFLSQLQGCENWRLIRLELLLEDAAPLP
jgi:hypothetical protein